MVRVAIREQLAALVIFAVLVGLCIVSIPVWLYVNKFVESVELGGLTLTASLKAARIASEIELLHTACRSIATRILIQRGFSDFYNTNGTSGDWDNARQDLLSAMGATGYSMILQARLYSRNTTGNASGLFDITGGAIDPIALPYTNSNGLPVMLGDETDPHGFPP